MTVGVGRVGSGTVGVGEGVFGYLDADGGLRLFGRASDVRRQDDVGQAAQRRLEQLLAREDVPVAHLRGV